MSWIVLSIIPAFLWALTNVIDKFIFSKYTARPMVLVMVWGVIGFLMSVAVAVFQGIAILSFWQTVIAIVASACAILMIFCYYKAVQIAEISSVIPLFYLTPLFILVIAGMFLGEVFTVAQYGGIVLLVVGAMVIVTKGWAGITMGRAFWFAVLVALFSAVNEVLTKYLLGSTDFWTVFAYVRFFAFLGVIPVCIFYRKDARSLYRQYRTIPFRLMAISEFISYVAILFRTAATAIGFVTLVNALASVQPFFVLLFAVVLSVFYPKILKEEISGATVLRKSVAILCMFVGGLLIS